jgi:hypothetical protein
LWELEKAVNLLSTKMKLMEATAEVKDAIIGLADKYSVSIFDWKILTNFRTIKRS